MTLKSAFVILFIFTVFIRYFIVHSRSCQNVIKISPSPPPKRLSLSLQRERERDKIRGKESKSARASE